VAAEDFVRQMIQTFTAHDSKAWAAAYAADAVVVDPQYAAPLRGRDAIEKDISDFFNTFPDMSWKSPPFWAAAII
jgi:ketosteroid isomerase-like protein